MEQKTTRTLQDIKMNTTVSILVCKCAITLKCIYATLCWKFVTDFEISNEQEEQSITLLYIHVCRLYVSMDVILQYPISFELVH